MKMSALGIRSLAPALLLAGALLGGAAGAEETVSHEHYKRGMAAYALEDWDAAIAEFEAGFRLEPKAAFLYNIGQAYRQSKRVEPAVKFYRKYLELAPEDAPDRAEVELLIANLQHAIDERDRALQQPPTGVTRPPESERPPSVPVPLPAPRIEKKPPPITAVPARALPEGGPRRDPVGLALLGSGGALVLAGVALAIYSGVTGNRSVDRSVNTDLGVREDLGSRAFGTGIAGYSAIGVGVAVLLGGGIKLALRPRRARIGLDLRGGPGALSATLGGSF